jgi:hypothetical protein
MSSYGSLSGADGYQAWEQRWQAESSAMGAARSPYQHPPTAFSPPPPVPPRWFSPPPVAQQPPPPQSQYSSLLGALGRPGAESEQNQALAALTLYGLALVPVPADGDCFFTAFLWTAQAAGVPGTDMSTADLREMLARMLEDPWWRDHIPADRRQTALNAWTARQATTGGAIDPRLLSTDTAWRSIAAQIRTTGGWADLGGDLAPYLAAARFGARINILHPTGVPETIGDPAATTTITLYHPTNHWDATAPTTRPFTDAPPGGPGPSNHDGHTQAWMADASDAMTRGLHEAITATTDPHQQQALQAALTTWTTTSHPPPANPPTPHIDHIKGIDWATSTHSARDHNGQLIPLNQRACVSITIGNIGTLVGGTGE